MRHAIALEGESSDHLYEARRRCGNDFAEALGIVYLPVH